MARKRRTKQRILCVCKGGNVRSVHLAFLLKYKYGKDALAVGHEGNTRETLAMLCQWADLIILTEPYMRRFIPQEFHAKTGLMNVGPDRWASLHNELCGLFDIMITDNLKLKSVGGAGVRRLNASMGK